MPTLSPPTLTYMPLAKSASRSDSFSAAWPYSRPGPTGMLTNDFKNNVQVEK